VALLDPDTSGLSPSSCT